MSTFIEIEIFRKAPALVIKYIVPDLDQGFLREPSATKFEIPFRYVLPSVSLNYSAIL